MALWLSRSRKRGYNLTRQRENQTTAEIVKLDGNKIRDRYAPDTFVKVLEEVGLERVARLDIKCRYQPLKGKFDEILDNSNFSYDSIFNSV